MQPEKFNLGYGGSALWGTGIERSFQVFEPD
jgi:hypothetical protein